MFKFLADAKLGATLIGAAIALMLVLQIVTLWAVIEGFAYFNSLIAARVG